MSDKHLSGEEKRKLLKEQYKQDLKLRKQFLNNVKAARSQNRINKALNDMVEAHTGDDSDEWIEKLNQESALSEAKLDLALEGISGDLPPEPPKEKSVEEMLANDELSPEDMMALMKQQMGMDGGLQQESPAGEEPKAEVEVEVKAEEIPSVLEELQPEHQKIQEEVSAEVQEDELEASAEDQEDDSDDDNDRPSRNMLDHIG